MGDRDWTTAEALKALRPTKADLVVLGMREWPKTVQGVNRRAGQDGWERRKVGSSQAWEYRVASLPQPVRDALLDCAVKSAPAVTEPVSPVDPSSLADWQRKGRDARAAILQHVNSLVLLSGTWRQAALKVVATAQRRELPEVLQKMVPIANAKSGKAGARTLSLRTLQRWFEECETGGVNALAPKDRPAQGAPAWSPYFLPLYRIPSKPSIAESLERLAEVIPPHIAIPSYDQVKRFLNNMDVVERNRGRMGPRELKSIRPHVVRDTSELWPLDVVSADGHTLDAEVQNPRHGRPFRPEITSVIDYATHACIGWSASLKENAFGVMEAILYMVMRHGTPAIWYVDNGPGYNNRFMESAEAPEIIGLLGRLGITKENSRPYASQARGLIERSHQTIWVRGAKRLPTYMGAPMDKEAKNKVFKLTRADIEAAGRSRHMMTWDEFKRWAQDRPLRRHQAPLKGPQNDQSIPPRCGRAGPRRHRDRRTALHEERRRPPGSPGVSEGRTSA
jgi:putative transposase